MEHRFNVQAARYDEHAEPQRRLLRCLLPYLPDTPPARILELGAGTGLLTRALLERYPQAHIDAVDVAPNMVAYARQSFGGESRVAWHVGDAENFSLPPPYPLIASNAALQWVTDLAKTCRTAWHNLTDEGVWVAGMMLHGTLHELRTLRAQIAPHKMSRFTLPQCAQIQSALEQAGFVVELLVPQPFRFVYPNMDTFLRAIHEQGVTGGSTQAGYTPLNRTELQELQTRYAEKYKTANGLYATYQTAVFRALKSID